MNYKKIYSKIIQNRVDNPIFKKDGYCENHHIKPESLGGSDNKENLVNLSAREHFIAHYLLAKMYKKESNEWYKMNHAFMMMKCNSIHQKRYFNSRLYEALKGDFSTVMSYAQSGKGNSQYGSMWVSHIEKEENKKIPKNDLSIWEIDGWIKGRNKWKVKYTFCDVCGCNFLVKDRAVICSDECRAKRQAETNKTRIGKHLKVTDKVLLKSLSVEKNVARALKAVGLSGGANFDRAYKLLNKED